MKFASYILMLSVSFLTGLGMVMLYSSSMGNARDVRSLQVQSVLCVLGIVLATIASRMDYQWLKKTVFAIGGITLLLLIAVKIPHIGLRINGARRWLSAGAGLTFQPSEFAKTTLIIVMAWYAERYRRQFGTFKRGLFLPGVIVAAFAGLVYIEPDHGTAALMLLVASGMMFIAGTPWKFISLAAIVVVAFTLFSLRGDKMRNNRIEAWQNLEAHKSDVGYQTYQGILALGSGGLTGKGLGESRQKHGFLREQTTDFIFAVVGEELGLAGTASVILAFILLTFAGFYIAANAADTFGSLTASGITMLFCLEAMINIAVVTNTMPNKGMPLPFISRGGSNLVIMLINVGLLLSIARQAPSLQPSGDDDGEKAGNPFANPI